MKTAILILAAGSSSRMGTPKQLLPYKNTTLLGYTIEQVKQIDTKHAFCVLGANAEIIEKSIENYQIETIYNSDFKNGLSSSIVVGVKKLQHDFDTILIMLGDQPNVNSNYLNKLIKTSVENPSRIIASNYQNKIGVPAIFPKKYFNQLLELKGDKGARNILNNNKSDIIKMPPFNLTDIDTREDYQNLIN